jgi:epoxide hydrolase-like predicted phosphatase
MYRNIIFDIGGVLVEWQPREYLMQRFLNEDIETKVYDLTFGGPEWAELDAGRISRFAANQSMLEKARALGCAFEVQAVLDDWTVMLRTRYRVAEIASRLKKAGFHLYYCTNIPFDILDMMQRRSFWHLFEGGIASCEVQLLKPQPEIFQMLLDRCSLLPEESIFIDDNPENVKAAYELGITGIPMHAGTGALIRNLSACGIQVRGGI